MRVIRYTTTLKSRSDKVVLIPLGDKHLGANCIDEEKLRGFVEYIRSTPDVYWLGMGDYLDAINYSDVRFDESAIADWCRGHLSDLITVQKKYWRDMFYPIRHRCLGLLEGNHEWKIREKYHQDVVEWMAQELGVPHLSQMAMIRWSFNRSANSQTKIIDIWAAHGYDASRTDGAAINNIVNMSKEYEADIYLMAHCHRKIVADRERIVILGGDEPIAYARKRLYVRTGSFMLANADGKHSGYAERKCMPPIPTGAVKIVIEPFRCKKVQGRSIELPVHTHVME